jgi:hypothetical protein
MQALIAAGDSPLSAPILAAIDFLHGRHDSHGGWINTSATAFAIQGLQAAGVDLTDKNWLVDGHGPFNALAAYQKVDGPFNFNHGLRQDNANATRLAIALNGLHYPSST